MITKFNGVTKEYPTIYALEQSGVDLCQESGFIKEKAFIDFLKSRGFEDISITPSGRGIGRNNVKIDEIGYGTYDFHSRFWMEKLLTELMWRSGNRSGIKEFVIKLD